MGVTNAIEGGYDTARISAAEQDRIAREEREDAARRYLERTGNADLLPVFGLVENPKPKRQPRARPGGSRQPHPTKES